MESVLDRVIFRKEKGSFGSDGLCFLACYPDDDALPGRIAATPMRITKGFTSFEPYSGLTFFEPYEEVSDNYYYNNTRPVKDKSLQEELRMELEKHFNGDIQFAVCTKR